MGHKIAIFVKSYVDAFNFRSELKQMSLFDKLYLNILQQKILWFSLAIVSSWIYSARNTLNEDLQEGVINLESSPKTDD